MACLSCAVHLHQECEDDSIQGLDRCCCDVEPIVSGEVKEIILGGRKANEDVKDPTSTGRKRAAALKPIIDGMTCEWAWLLEAGGGVIPIVGCNGNTLVREKGNDESTGNIHHGPNKSTLCNTDDNLHRVCGVCHNRWHTLNDNYYPKSRPANGEDYLPIPPLEAVSHNKYERASDEVLARSEIWWNLPGTRPEYRAFVMGE